MLEQMNAASAAFRSSLQTSRPKTLIITLGTAKVHVLKASGAVVNNCHKQAHALFSSRLLGVDEVVGSLGKAIEMLRQTRVILTVSPVRHTRETLTVNSLSKSVLRVACSELEKRYPNIVCYFPSYEIVIDELRDYRWYERDLIHPNDHAREIIFDPDSRLSEASAVVDWSDQRQIERELQNFKVKN